MRPYCERTREELLQEKQNLEARYQEIREKGLKLDMSRGKPAKAQLDLANGMMDVLNSDSDMACEAGVCLLYTSWIYCRYYGIITKKVTVVLARTAI